VALVTVFVLWAVVFTENLASVAAAVLAEIISMFGSVFVLASAGFLILAVVLALSRFGRIRLGGDDERPEFRTVSWVAMMFSAGMGIGLMFWGVILLLPLGRTPLGDVRRGRPDWPTSATARASAT